MNAEPLHTSPSAVPPHRPWVGFLLIVGSLILILLGFFGYGIFSQYRRIQRGEIDLAAYTTSKVTTSNVNTVSVARVGRSLIETTDDPTQGPADALVTIVEFGDFECPHCAEAVAVVERMRSTYGDRIRFIFRDFPNPSIHENALNAAHAAACANEQGKFWLYHNVLFQNHTLLADANLVEYAQRAGLNVLAYTQCQQSKRHMQEIIDDYNAGVQAGVQGTPTWFINGYRIEGVLAEKDFEKIIDYGLNGQL